jgi:thioredoxin-dependent peroxiredoxin
MALSVGDKIVSFKLPNQNGEEISIEDILGKSNIVIYFYPKDNSLSCTKEACGFRDMYEAYLEHDVVVLGVSSDSVSTHKKFHTKNHLNFDVLSDKNSKVRALFGVPSKLWVIPGRVTYVINKKGVIVKIYDSLFNPSKHIKETLDIFNIKQ